MPTWLKYVLSAVVAFGTGVTVTSQSPTPDNKPVPVEVLYISGAIAAANAIANLRIQPPKKEN